MKEIMNILLVEDNDLDVEILHRARKKMGMPGTMVRAQDGLEALDILQSDDLRRALPSPFVVLLDINMPRMNGHEFLEELRKTELIADARVFVFTTSDNPVDVSKAYAQHASGYIKKPSNSKDLTSILDALYAFWAKCENPSPEYRNHG
ncbi:response regulator [Cognatishimia sp. SS12]|uniref:response regulator n=1 Tax=Cognatishimia sp. SS12 TaxID=2979465 RepID=UPI00232E27AD|nr:response regulator [Cognatishimia sp. SS12]MDC0738478.1 response regulator [Cognatishimia sp. SS12]